LNSFRTSPNTDGDKPAGVNVDAIGSDPVSSQIGIQPGDTVKSVNGIRVNSLEDILGLNERLQNAPEIRVVVERQGRHTTLVYKIR
jgi:type II secretory pathway component PulC